MKLINRIVCTLAVGMLCTSFCFAKENPAVQENKGLAIAKEVQERDTGWGNTHAHMKMVLTNRHGATSEREMEMKTLEVEGDGDKSLTIFHEPRDVQGTAFLSFSHALEPDQQWLYLPALKRVKRISSANKSGPFLGSEFAFEDLASFEVDKYTYDYLRDDVIDNYPVFVVKYTPRYEHSGYQHLEVWVDQEDYIMRKIDFYDRKGDLLKTLLFKKYQKFNDRFWRSLEFSVDNHQTGKSTQLYWKDYAFDTGLTDNDFTQNALKRAR